MAINSKKIVDMVYNIYFWHWPHTCIQVVIIQQSKF